MYGFEFITRFTGYSLFASATGPQTRGSVFFVFVPVLMLVAPILSRVLSLKYIVCHVHRFWRSAKQSRLTHSQSRRPLLVGIAGDSASGKDRLSTLLLHLVGMSSSVIIQGDGYHKWERGDRRWKTTTHLHPQANHLRRMARHTKALSRCQNVKIPQYDHVSGHFVKPRKINNVDFIIVQGLHALYLKSMREVYSLKIFIEPERLVQLSWKLSRDMAERGYNKKEVIHKHKEREQDAKRHILPQRSHADWIIGYFSDSEIDEVGVLNGNLFKISSYHILRNDAPIQALLLALQIHADCKITMEVVDGDSSRSKIFIEGSPSKAQIASVAQHLFVPMYSVFPQRQQPRWWAGHDGVHQLIALSLLAGHKSSGSHY